jgi:hypothetical protein
MRPVLSGVLSCAIICAGLPALAAFRIFHAQITNRTKRLVELSVRSNTSFKKIYVEEPGVSQPSLLGQATGDLEGSFYLKPGEFIKVLQVKEGKSYAAPRVSFDVAMWVTRAGCAWSSPLKSISGPISCSPRTLP